MEVSAFGVALAVILTAIVIIAARRQIAAAIKRLWTATLGAWFEPKSYDDDPKLHVDLPGRRYVKAIKRDSKPEGVDNGQD